jgi:hypothetical protein
MKNGGREKRDRYWKKYRYQWDDGEYRPDLYRNDLEGYDLDGIPPGSLVQSESCRWTSTPTAEQQQMIDAGAVELPNTTDKETGAITEHYIFRHQHLPVQIHNSTQVSISGFQCFSLMTTCKRINQEVAELLYGKNLFVFDTRNILPSLNDASLKRFESTRHYIPGLQHRDGTSTSNWENAQAIHKMFDKDEALPTWLKNNPFTYFLRKIGPLNASLITKIKFEGHFRGIDVDNNNDHGPYSFTRLLPIYQVILQNVCGNLQEITLHNQKPCIYNSSSTIHGPSHMTDEEKVDDAVGEFVKGLPWLKKLQLGDYKSLEDREEDIEWGLSRRWVDIVNNRSTDGVVRPAAFPFVKNVKTPAQRGRGVGRYSGGPGGANTSAAGDQEGSVYVQENNAATRNEDNGQISDPGESFTLVQRRGGRNTRNHRGNRGSRGGNRNNVGTGHQNEDRQVITGTVANDNACPSSRGGSSQRGNGRGRYPGRGGRGRGRGS